jgi:hypothetical protein
MKLPFTISEFLDVFKSYNNSVFPLQFIFLVLALTVIYGILFKVRFICKSVFYFLGFLWMWIGVVYHGYFFSTINKAAFVFGFFCLLQSFLFVIYGSGKKMRFEFNRSITSTAAVAILIYAIVIYPVFAYFNGHAYPATPSFSLPCPTTIYTFGILLLVKQRLPAYLLIIPFAWSLIGITAALKLHMEEDFGLIISALITSILLYYKQERVKVASQRHIIVKHVS